jgi:hypothetical protein
MIDRMEKPRRVATRRSFVRWAAYGTLGSALAASGYARFLEPWWIDYSHVRIPIAHLPPAFEGLRIAHLSDLHHNPVSLGEIEEWIDKANHLAPDLVALTGDYITGGTLAHEVANRLKQLRAPLGVVACLGNHDYGAAYPTRVPDHLAAGRETRKILERAGIEVLVNEYTTRRRDNQTLYLAGGGDLWTDDYDINFMKNPPGRPLIVLAHNPDMLYSLHYPNFDLMLSGHTHGGQIKFPFLGPPRLSIRHRHLAEGHFTLNDRQIYVSRGLGYLTSLRFRARPELGIIELKSS